MAADSTAAAEGAKEIDSFISAPKEPGKKAQQPATGPQTADLRTAEWTPADSQDRTQLVADESGPQGLVNKPAPQLTLDTIGGGKLDLSSLKSKNVVVLDFWATWCPPCRKALPILADVTKSYEAKGVKFFAVDQQEDASKVQDYLKTQGLNITVALDKDGQGAAKYRVTGIPQSVIIGKDGIVRVVHEGFSSDLKTKLAAELDDILAGKQVSE
jgi:thiol-disulfide isomerase/thioredoxin